MTDFTFDPEQIRITPAIDSQPRPASPTTPAVRIAAAVDRAERGLQLARERGDVAGHASAIDALPDLQAARKALQGLERRIERFRDSLTPEQRAAVAAHFAGEHPDHD